MKEYTIKELAAFINSINGNDSIIEVSVGSKGGIVGAVAGGHDLSVKITPQEKDKIEIKPFAVPTAKTAETAKTTPTVLYLCRRDDEKCEECHEECKYTSNVAHAQNFERVVGGIYKQIEV